MSEAARQESAARSSREIRAALDHPVIDADGHIIEFLPAVRDFLVEEGGVSWHRPSTRCSVRPASSMPSRSTNVGRWGSSS